MHGQNENRRLLVDAAQAPQERQAAQSAGLHGEIHHDHIGLALAVEAKPLGSLLCLNDLPRAGALQEPLAALKDDWVVVDNKDVRHGLYSLAKGHAFRRRA